MHSDYIIAICSGLSSSWGGKLHVGRDYIHLDHLLTCTFPASSYLLNEYLLNK